MTELNWRDAASSAAVEIEPIRRRWVTQVGGKSFNEQPRWHKEISLSMTAGRQNVEAAVRIVFGRPARPVDRVRFFRVKELVLSEYLPHASPSSRNPEHVSIRAPIAEDDVELHMAWWARPERVRLQSIAKP